MAWRVAKSLEVLLAEINEIAPGRSKASDGSIGDTAHASGASDHNPNAAGVVCARDFTHDPGDGADMNVLSKRVVASGHPALKYVIWNRRIWQGSWQPYYGSNPHDHHMHVSVGRGPDGRSTGPYDDTSPWGLTDGDDDMEIGEVFHLTKGQASLLASDPGVQDGLAVGTALGGAYTFSRTNSWGIAAIQREQAAAKARDLAILEKLAGVDTQAILAHIEQLAADDKARDEALLNEVKNLASGGATADEIVDVLAARLAG